LQHARSQITRDKLVDAALNSVYRHGHKGTTTQQICEGTGLTQGALFRHFETKNEVLHSAFSRALERILEHCDASLHASRGQADAAHRLWQLAESTAAGRCHLVAIELAVAARTQPELHRLLHEEALHYRDRFVALLGAHFPEYASHREFIPVVLSLITQYVGMAVTNCLLFTHSPSSERTEWARRVLQSEIARIAGTPCPTI